MVANEIADLAILREGCFRYFELGGEAVAGPVSLLSAYVPFCPIPHPSTFLGHSNHHHSCSEVKLINSITPAPLLLAYHFFSVALYSIYILFTSGVPTSPGQQPHVPRIHEYPYTAYLAFRVVSLFFIITFTLLFYAIRDRD